MLHPCSTGNGMAMMTNIRFRGNEDCKQWPLKYLKNGFWMFVCGTYQTLLLLLLVQRK